MKCLSLPSLSSLASRGLTSGGFGKISHAAPTRDGHSPGRAVLSGVVGTQRHGESAPERSRMKLGTGEKAASQEPSS